MGLSFTSGRRASRHDHRPGGLAGHEAAFEMSKASAPIRQLTTHNDLVRRTDQWRAGARLPLHAIIVPASRPAPNLDQAITLARASHCQLLILCSHKAKPAEVHELLADRMFDEAIVVDLPAGYGHELFDFRRLDSIKDDMPTACSHYGSNLSMKRNVGLVVARMVGWRRIFFLDDDIRDINPSDAHGTVTMLGSCRTAGMRVARFPDNSVACHAHRMTGGRQDVFVTGAALAVDCQEDIGFFPDIYNEDWLFFYDDAARGRLGSSGRIVTQLRYDPFDDAQRAAWQEFGDVLAEGLYALLGSGLGFERATEAYWDDFLYARKTFLQAIKERSEMADLEIRERLLRSVEVAQKCSVGISPETLERYVRLWRRDLHDWQRRLAGVSQVRSPDAALRTLGLARSTRSRTGSAAHPDLAPPEKVRTTLPFSTPDYYEHGGTTPGWERRGGRNGRATSPVHPGSAAVQEAGFLASARRGFRNHDQVDAPTEPSPGRAAGRART
jgi:hypothetical protein